MLEFKKAIENQIRNCSEMAAWGGGQLKVGCFNLHINMQEGELQKMLVDLLDENTRLLLEKQRLQERLAAFEGARESPCAAEEEGGKRAFFPEVVVWFQLSQSFSYRICEESLRKLCTPQ